MRAVVAGFVVVAIFASWPAGTRETRNRELIPGEAIPEQLQRKGACVNRYGEEVHKPSEKIGGGVPDGATARCRDDTYSFSHSRSGTCLRHGGVGAWLR